ncbi:MAG: phage major capsid protein [Patescibacteria group bacterium]
MGAGLIGDVTALLRDMLLPYVKENLPKSTILMDQLKRNSGVTAMNDEFLAAIWTSRHGGVANMADDGNSVTNARGRTSSRGTVTVETVYASFRLSKLAMDSSRTGAMSVENVLTAQARTLMSDAKRHINRQYYNDGVGAVSQVRATGGSVGTGTIAVQYMDANLDDGRSIDWYGTINGDISPTKYFAIDQIIGVGTAGAADGTVASVTGTSIVCGAPTAIVTAANDTIYIQDGDGEGAGTSELLGARAALSSTTGTSTYAGLARTTSGWLPSFGSASEAVSLDRMYERYLRAHEYAQEGDKYIFIMNITPYRKYGALLTAMRQSINETELLGGWKGLSFAAGAGVVGVFLDYEVPDGEVLCLNLDSWTVCQVGDLEWVSGADQGSLERIQQTLTYEAVLAWFTNLMCLAPAANGRDTRKTN